MSASTPIASLVQSMLADGVEHGAIVRAVEAAEADLSKRSSSPAASRGTRLAADWNPPSVLIAYATSRGMPASRVAVEVEKFKNYWIAKTGAGATKRDWEATWRNWVLNAMEASHVATGNRRGSGIAVAIAGRPPTGADAVLAGMGRLAHRLATNRNAAQFRDRQVAEGADAAGELDLGGSGT
jgi:hypothetical protein